MSIGILGSYFNPPHLGHILVTQQCLDFAGFDKVWLLPGNKSTFNKKLIDVKHRLAMTRLIDLPNTEVSTLEIDYQLDGNTINLVPLLKRLYPENKFTFIIGSDQLSTFNKWGRWQELLKQMQFLVVPRAGYPMEPLYEGMQPLVHPLFVSTNISSTFIRQRLEKKLAIGNFVPQEVTDYIAQHQLYQ